MTSAPNTLTEGFFTSWQFANDMIDCSSSELAERIISLLNTRTPCIKIQGKLSTLSLNSIVLYMCPFDFLAVPVRNFEYERYEALRVCLRTREFTCYEIQRNKEVFTYYGFTGNKSGNNFDKVDAIRACFTYAVKLYASKGMPEEMTQKYVKQLFMGYKNDKDFALAIPDSIEIDDLFQLLPRESNELLYEQAELPGREEITARNMEPRKNEDIVYKSL